MAKKDDEKKKESGPQKILNLEGFWAWATESGDDLERYGKIAVPALLVLGFFKHKPTRLGLIKSLRIARKLAMLGALYSRQPNSRLSVFIRTNLRPRIDQFAAAQHDQLDRERRSWLPFHGIGLIVRAVLRMISPFPNTGRRV